MWPNRQFPADLVTFTEEIINGKFLFLCSDACICITWFNVNSFITVVRSSSKIQIPPKLFWGKGVLKICSTFTVEHPCRSAISIKLQSNSIEITFRHGCSPVNLLHIFRILFLKNTSERVLLRICILQL